ncbi:phospholipid carrier-dependent glycosyltransferase [Luteimonas lutimaris]|uniref:Glycosyltransferase family 39 protein n=1 Tax=Luteimonas lutimaris TaxID=698645 RepID=A0ABP7MM11_9GAMM
MATTKSPYDREFWLLAVFALLVIGAGIGLRHPWPADEPRFVLVVKQMWESGDWWFPRRGQELYSDKPPLYFWLLGACYALVRNWTVAFLLPSLLASLGTLWLTFDLGRRLWSRRAGLWAAAAVLCAFQFAYQAKHAQIDPTVAFFIMLGFYGLARHLLLGPHWRWFWLGCFAAGLGVITKGVGFLALLALLPYAWMRWRSWQGLAAPAPRGAGRWALGAVAVLAAVGLWLVPMLWLALSGGDPAHRAYVDDLLFRQTATRYADAWHHHEPAWYFLRVVAVSWLPLSLLLPWLARPWREAWRARDGRVWLPLATFALVLLFFSLSSGKRDMYILPALPMLALAAAPYLDGLLERRGVRRVLFALVLLLGAGLLALGVAALVGEPGFELKLETGRGMPLGQDGLWWTLAAMGSAIVAAALWLQPRRAVALVAGMTAVLWCGWGLALAPQLDGESSSRDLMHEVRELAGPGTGVGLVAWSEQTLLQAQGPTVEFGFKRTPVQQWNDGMAWALAAPDSRVLLVLEVDELKGCLRRAGARHVGVASRRAWSLVSPREVTADCRSLPETGAAVP